MEQGRRVLLRGKKRGRPTEEWSSTSSQDNLTRQRFISIATREGQTGEGIPGSNKSLRPRLIFRNMTKSDPRMLAGIYCPETNSLRESGFEGSSGISESSLETPKQHQFGGPCYIHKTWKLFGNIELNPTGEPLSPCPT